MSSPRTLVQHYESCFAKHGDTAKGFDWPDENGARVRHQVMWEIIPNEATNVSILDFGCGSMQFLDYLSSRGIYDSARLKYYGIDLSEQFTEISKRKYPSIWSRKLDILKDEDFIDVPAVDYVICNGIFTLKNKIPTAAMD